MTRTSFTVGLLTLSLISGSVWANQQDCDQKRNAVGNWVNKIKDQENRVKDLDNQIESVAKQQNADQKVVADLKKQKADKLKEIEGMQIQLEKLKSEENAACNPGTKCEGHKTKLGDLKTEITKLKEDVSKLKDQIQVKKVQVETLNTKLTANKSESVKLGCDNLEKGKSPDSTIEQCRKLYRDGMADKEGIPKHQQEVDVLKQDAGNQKNKATGVIAKVDQLKNQIVTDCAGDQVVKESDDLSKTDTGADGAVKNATDVKTKLTEVQKIRMVFPVVKNQKPTPSTTTTAQ